MASNDESIREGFKVWLFSLQSYIETFEKTFPPEQKSLLDNSPASLDLVGDWILKNYENSRFRRNPDIMNGLVGYVGVTFRINLDARWNIYIDKPDFPYNRVPVIERFDDLGSVICPMVSIQKTLEKGANWFMRVELEAWMKSKHKQT